MASEDQSGACVCECGHAPECPECAFGNHKAACRRSQTVAARLWWLLLPFAGETGYADDEHADALVAAQRRALSAVEKAYLAERAYVAGKARP